MDPVLVLVDNFGNLFPVKSSKVICHGETAGNEMEIELENGHSLTVPMNEWNTKVMDTYYLSLDETYIVNRDAAIEFIISAREAEKKASAAQIASTENAPLVSAVELAAEKAAIASEKKTKKSKRPTMVL